MSADWPEPEQGVLLNVVSSLPLEGFGCPSPQLRSWEQVFFWSMFMPSFGRCSK